MRRAIGANNGLAYPYVRPVILEPSARDELNVRPHAFQAQHPESEIHHPAVFQTMYRAICSISGPRMLDFARFKTHT